jgi:hypothetical protein
MILNDYSQLYIAGALTFGSDFDKGKDAKKQIDIMRHTVLNTLLSDKRKYGKEYGEFVIAVDSREYWRRDIFPHYKGARKKNREESNTDWKAIFDIGEQLREEFKEVFPYRFVHVEGAEADDIIACLAKYTQENDLTSVGVFDNEPQRVLIKSSDGDFGQLHKFENVRQWSPIQKKWVTKSGKHDLLEKILTGDPGDGIPNIKTADDHFMQEDPPRQKSITAKLKAQAIKQVEAGEQVYFGDKTMDINFRRNRQLIDFDYIPEHIYTKVVEAYKASAGVKDKGKIFNYFVKHRCKLLMEHIGEF